MRLVLLTWFLLMFAGSAMADAVDVGLVVDAVVDVIAAISLIGTAVIGIFVLIRANRWLRNTL
jgi:hypothetical protein